MLNKGLISTPAPPFHPDDTVAFALDLMEELKVSHWPVVQDGLYKGMMTEEILLNEDAELNLGDLDQQYLPFSVPVDEHFLSATRLMSERNLTTVAVVMENNEYSGVILDRHLLQHLAVFCGSNTPGGMIVLEISPMDFSVGEISRLIETNDAQIRQLNTEVDDQTGHLFVTIKINKQEVSGVIATLQRYDYKIAYFAGEEQYENELRKNYHHLLHYLDM